MPHISINSVQYYYETHGTGQETLVFSHGLLWSRQMFHKQVTAFKSKYRVITYDHRGQGQTAAPADGYDMDTLYEDAVTLLETLKLGPVIFAGLSMGGFIGMRIAARRPDLVKALILMETTCEPEPEENRPKYRTLNKMVRFLGPWAVAKPVMKIMFGQKFLNDPARTEERNYWIAQFKANRRPGILRAVNGVIDRNGICDELGRIACPTLVMVGDQDVATVPAKSEKIHRLIPHSELHIIPGAGHTSSVEEAEFINEKIVGFLKKIDLP